MSDEAYMQAKFKKARNFVDCIWSNEPVILVLCNSHYQQKLMFEEFVHKLAGKDTVVKYSDSSISLPKANKKFKFVSHVIKTFGYDRQKTLLYDVRNKEKL